MERNNDPQAIILDRQLFEFMLAFMKMKGGADRRRDELILHARKWNPQWSKYCPKTSLPTRSEEKYLDNRKRKLVCRRAGRYVGSIIYTRQEDGTYRPYRVTGIRPHNAETAIYKARILYEEDPRSWFTDSKFHVELKSSEFVYERDIPEGATILNRDTDIPWRDARTGVGVNLRFRTISDRTFVQEIPITKADVDNHTGPTAPRESMGEDTNFRIFWWALQEFFPDVRSLKLVCLGSSGQNQKFIPVLYYKAGDHEMEVLLMKDNDVEPKVGLHQQPKLTTLPSDVAYMFQPFTANKALFVFATSVSVPKKVVSDESKNANPGG